jgi:hypothetical protein
MQTLLLKAPDCLATVLSPNELQQMRCVSKGIHRAIAKEVMLQCIQSTIDRYAGPHAMPDGVTTRFYSTFGNTAYDICRVEAGYQLNPGLHTLQIAHRMDTTTNTPSPEIELDITLLSDRRSRLKNVSKYVLDRRSVTSLGFEVKEEQGESRWYFAVFKGPHDPLAPRHGEAEQIFFQCFDFYANRVVAM